MTSSNDFEKAEQLERLFHNTTDEVLESSRTLLKKKSLIPLDTILHLTHEINADASLSNFIKRRELYQNELQRSVNSRAGLLLLGVTNPKIYLYRYLNGNVKIGFNPNITPPPPPPQYGARSSTGLTRYAKKQIRDSVAHMMTIKQKLSFITLSYSDDALPPHKEAKKQLSNFFKRLRYQDNSLVYTWVAEIQPKRLKEKGISAIHFHITTPSYFDVDWIRDTWRRITNCDKSRPHIKVVNKPAHYMSKYMSKDSHLFEGEGLESEKSLIHWIGGNRFGLCHKNTKALRPIEHLTIDGEYSDYLKIANATAGHFNNVCCSDYSLVVRPPRTTALKSILTPLK